MRQRLITNTTGTIQKETIDLTQFESTEYDGSGQTELHKNEFEFDLPQSKRKVTFQALTESKERKIKYQLEAQKSFQKDDKTDKQLTIRLKNTILSVDGDTNKIQLITSQITNYLQTLGLSEHI